jgi:hypothetical protein
MLAYREETIKFWCTIRDGDGLEPTTVADVNFSIRQDDREITKPAAMTQDSGTRYYAEWDVPILQAFGQYYVLVTATVDSAAWEQVIAIIEIRENIEAFIIDLYNRSLSRRGFNNAL